MRRRKRIAYLLATVLVIWITYVGLAIWNFETDPFPEKADCVIVLGAAVAGNSPSPVFEERIRHAINIYKEGLAEKFIFTGGFGDGASFSESGVAEQYAIANGVPPADIYKEENSRTTLQNITEAKAVMHSKHLNSAILISDPLHLKRASRMAKNLGINHVASATPTTRYQSQRTKLPFALRELYFYNHYKIFNQ